MLRESAARLKAMSFVIAMMPDGRARMGKENTREMFEAHKMGAAIWTPEEMLRYVEMPEAERHAFRNLKQSFKANVEFKDAAR